MREIGIDHHALLPQHGDASLNELTGFMPAAASVRAEGVGWHHCGAHRIELA